MTDMVKRSQVPQQNRVIQTFKEAGGQKDEKENNSIISNDNVYGRMQNITSTY